MALLEFGSDSQELLWMGEAISTGAVKEGDLCKVMSITRTADGRGFLLETVHKGQTVYDYAWRKGKTGSTLATMFDDPTVADENSIYCKAQSKVKNAVLQPKEEKKCRWELKQQDGKDVLVFFGTAVRAVTPPTTPETKAS